MSMMIVMGGGIGNLRALMKAEAATKRKAGIESQFRNRTPEVPCCQRTEPTGEEQL